MGNITPADVAVAASNKVTQFNDNIASLDIAISEKNSYVVTDTNALTITNIKTSVLNIIGNGSPVPTATITLTVPSTDRGIIAIQNNTSFGINVIISGQVANIPQIKSSKTGLIYVGDTGCILISSGAEIVGTDVQAYDANLAALAALATTGIVTRTASNTFTTRTIVGTTPITITNGDGVAGNPTVSIADAAITYAKIQNVGADKILGAITAGVVSEIPITAQGRALIAGADSKANRATLDLVKPPYETTTLPRPTFEVVPHPLINGINAFNCGRTSSAYVIDNRGILVWTPAFMWRHAYYITGEYRGILIEDAATNLFLHTEDISNAVWTKTGTTVTLNNLIAPNNATIMDTLIEDSATSTHMMSQTVTMVTTNRKSSCSVYVQASGCDFIKIRMVSSANTSNYVEAIFQLSTRTVTGVVNGGAATVARGNFLENRAFFVQNQTIHRIALQGLVTASATGVICEFMLSKDGVNFSYTGDGVSGMGFWGLQIEDMTLPTLADTTQAFASTYYPSGASQGVRSNENTSVLSLTNQYPNIFGATRQGTVYIEYSLQLFDSDQTIIALNDGLAPQPEQIDLRGGSSTAIARLRTNSSQVFSYSQSYTNVNDIRKTALGWSVGYQRVYMNGTTAAGGTGASNMATFNLTQIELGKRVGGGFGNFYIRDIKIYPTMLSDSQLEELTRVNVI